ncbi:MAG TPA: hypothetical protein VHF25_09720 [Nitriliruptorales bacterium]|nr:hypothetical protein [Nitriliruptorales bacterium]
MFRPWSVTPPWFAGVHGLDTGCRDLLGVGQRAAGPADRCGGRARRLEPDELGVDHAGDALRRLRRQRSRLEVVEAALTTSFDRRAGYRNAGHTSMQGWRQGELAWHTGMPGSR